MSEHENGSGRIYVTGGSQDRRTPAHTAERSSERAPSHDRPASPARPAGGTAALFGERWQNLLLLFAVILFGILLITFISVFVMSAGGRRAVPPEEDTTSPILGAVPQTDPPAAATTAAPVTTAAPPLTAVTAPAAETVTIGGIHSKYAALMDAEDGRLIAALHADERLYPASLTKLMTLIVARERIADLSSTVTFTRGMLYSLEADAMKVGYTVGERASALDLMYGAMLHSGCDATVGLAYLCAEDEAAFAELMTARAVSMGLTKTHFANSSGLFDPSNYSTARELAEIMRTALSDDLMREIIFAESYKTAGDGSDPATSRRLRDRLALNMEDYAAAWGAVSLEGFSMLGGKTGYIDESGSCLAAYAEDKNGHGYIIVTCGAHNMHEVLEDHYNILMRYAN